MYGFVFDIDFKQVALLRISTYEGSRIYAFNENVYFNLKTAASLRKLWIYS